jgi:hypothetical protein
MENDGYLITEPDGTVLKNITQMAARLAELKQKMLDAEAAFNDAEREYDYYAGTLLPMSMLNAGVSELTLADGKKLTVNRKFVCAPNKNAEDRKIQAEWLAAHGGEHLLKDYAVVDGRFIDKLGDVPFEEKHDINTQSLKAFLKDMVGAGGGGAARINAEDIPACFHFNEIVKADVEL